MGERNLQPAGNNRRSRARPRRRRPSKKLPLVRDWAELLPEVLSLIFRYLTSLEILWRAMAVCRSWRTVALEPHIWRRIDMCHHPELGDRTFTEELAMEAVDRSGGCVEEFYADDFCSDDLLSYIAERTAFRTTGLRCLVLVSPPRSLTRDGLSKFTGRFPEVLEIINPLWSRRLLCGGPPFLGLKCFCLYQQPLDTEYFRWDYMYPVNDIALEIANSMPHLQQLQLIYDGMTIEGLNAILDKCLLLEFLDIRLCYNIHLDASMEVRLEKIKTVRLPRDPFEEDDSDSEVEESDSDFDNDFVEDEYGCYDDSDFRIC